MNLDNYLGFLIINNVENISQSLIMYHVRNITCFKLYVKCEFKLCTLIFLTILSKLLRC